MGHAVKLRGWLLGAASLVCGVAMTPAHAYEPGYPGWSMPPGATLGMTAAPEPAAGRVQLQPDLCPADEHNGSGRRQRDDARSMWSQPCQSLLWSPGWTFLGATYEAMLLQPVTMADAGAPINSSKSGVHNTVISPAQLSWQLGNTGLFVKTGLAVVVPDGTITGPTGLGNIGNPWWIIQPSLSVSYLRFGWHVTANFSTEFNTANTYTGYRTGDILHADIAATRSFGQWSVGPVLTYVGQISNDTSSAYYHNTIVTDRYNLLAVGGQVSYNFGRVVLGLSATKDVLASATGGNTPTDAATITKGYHVYANVGFKF